MSEPGFYDLPTGMIVIAVHLVGGGGAAKLAVQLLNNCVGSLSFNKKRLTLILSTPFRIIFKYEYASKKI